MDGTEQTRALAAAAALRARFGDWDGAAELCLCALGLEPDSASLWLLLGKSRSGGGRNDAAIRCLTRALRLDPGSGEAMLLLLKAAGAGGRPDVALPVYRALLALQPDDAQLAFSHALMLHSARKLDDAIAAALRARSLAPGHAAIHHNLGQMFWQAGRRALAEQAYRTAADLDERWAVPRLALFRVQQQGTDPVEESIAVGRSLIGLDPSHADEVLPAVGLVQARLGRWHEALGTFRELAAGNASARAMLGEDIASGRDPGRADALFDGGVRRPSGAPPPMAGRFRAAYEAGGWEGRRIVVLMPKHINCDPAYIEHDITHYLTEAAAAAGLPVRFIDADEVSYPPFMTAEKRRRAVPRLDAIRQEILAFGPDIIVTDANSVGDGDTLNPDWLARLKAECRCRVAATVMDNYGASASVMEHWSPAVDTFLHFEPGSSEVLGAAGRSLLLMYVPVPRTFFSDADERGIASLFVGSASGGASGFRALWLSAAMTHLPDCVALLTSRLAHRSPSRAQYAELHRNARISMNFGRRPCGTVIVTGRTYESIMAGCLLLEQEGSRLSDFFTPWEHYIPFRDASELVGLVRCLSEREDRARRMAREAQRFMERHYAPEFFWPYVIASMPGASARAESEA